MIKTPIPELNLELELGNHVLLRSRSKMSPEEKDIGYIYSSELFSLENMPTEVNCCESSEMGRILPGGKI